MWKPVVDLDAVKRVAKGYATGGEASLDMVSRARAVNKAMGLGGRQKDKALDAIGYNKNDPWGNYAKAFGASEQGEPEAAPAIEAPTPQQLQPAISALMPQLSGLSTGVDQGLKPLDILNQDDTTDYRRGGPVSGGPPGIDTVPARLTNGEYVLPKPTAKAMGGKPTLDNLVLATTGKPPVGYNDGGLINRWLGRFDRKSQIDEAERKAMGESAAPPAAPPPPAPSTGTSMKDIMREIRAKHPPIGQKEEPVKYYTGGEAQRYPFNLRYAVAVDPAKYKKQDPNAPDYADVVPIVGLPDPDRAALIQKRRAQQASPQSTNIEGVIARGKAGEGTPLATLIAPVTSAAEVAPSIKQTRGGPQLQQGGEQYQAAQDRAILALDPNVTDGFKYAPDVEKVVTSGRPGATYNGPQGSMEYAGQGTGGMSPIGFDAPTMSEANANMRRGGGGGSFSVIGGAPFGVDEAAYAAMSPAEQSAVKVASIENSIAAIRDLRNARRETQGLPPVGQQTGLEGLGVRDQIALANLQRGLNNDQRAVMQDQVNNRFKLAEFEKSGRDELTAAQERFMEEAAPFAEQAANDFPWMQSSLVPFFQRASKIDPTDPSRAVGALAASYSTMESSSDKEPLFTVAGQGVTPAQAIAILNGEKPFNNWLKLQFAGEELYDEARRLAIRKIQERALQGLRDS